MTLIGDIRNKFEANMSGVEAEADEARWRAEEVECRYYQCRSKNMSHNKLHQTSKTLRSHQTDSADMLL